MSIIQRKSPDRSDAVPQSPLLYQKLKGYHQLHGYLYDLKADSRVALQGSVRLCPIPSGLKAYEQLYHEQSGALSTNVSLWLFDSEGRLSLGHQRFELPVTLCRMVLNDEGYWRSHAAHLCNSDSYRAELRLEGDCLSLTWQIRGPRKQQIIHMKYS